MEAGARRLSSASSRGPRSRSPGRSTPAVCASRSLRVLKKASEKLGNGWMTSNSTASGTRARIATRRLLQPLARLGPERVGAGEPLAVRDERHEPRALRVRARVGGGARHLGERDRRRQRPLGLPDRGRLRVGEHHARNGVVVRRRGRGRGCSRPPRGPGTCPCRSAARCRSRRRSPRGHPPRASARRPGFPAASARRRPCRARGRRPALAGRSPPAGDRRAARRARRTRRRTRRRRAAPAWRARRSGARSRRRRARRRAHRRAASARAGARGPCPRRAPRKRPSGGSPAPSRLRPGRRRAPAAGAGTSVSPVASRFVQTPSSSRRPGIGRDHRVRAGGDHHVVGRVGRHRRPRPCPARPGGRRRGAPRCPAPPDRPPWPRPRSSLTMKSRHSNAPSASHASADRLAGARRVARRLERLAGPKQRLGRDAGPVVALAADELRARRWPPGGRRPRGGRRSAPRPARHR